MTQIKIKKARTFPSGEQFFPITHTKAVIDDNGYTAESRLGAMQDEINNLQDGVVVVGEGMTPVPSDLAPTENSSNWVTSGGVFNALYDSVEVFTNSSEVTWTAGNVNSSGAIVTTYANMYKIVDVGSVTGCSVYLNSPTFKLNVYKYAGGKYQQVLGSLTGEVTRYFTLTDSSRLLLLFWDKPTAEQAQEISLSIHVASDKYIKHSLVDDVPTLNSENPVKSGGVYDATCIEIDHTSEVGEWGIRTDQSSMGTIVEDENDPHLITFTETSTMNGGQLSLNCSNLVNGKTYILRMTYTCNKTGTALSKYAHRASGSQNTRVSYGKGAITSGTNKSYSCDFVYDSSHPFVGWAAGDFGAGCTLQITALSVIEIIDIHDLYEYTTEKISDISSKLEYIEEQDTSAFSAAEQEHAAVYIENINNEWVITKPGSADYRQAGLLITSLASNVEYTWEIEYSTTGSKNNAARFATNINAQQASTVSVCTFLGSANHATVKFTRARGNYTYFAVTSSNMSNNSTLTLHSIRVYRTMGIKDVGEAMSSALENIGQDYTNVVSLYKDRKDLAVNVMGASSNFSCLLFSDIHGDSVALSRIMKLYTAWKNMLDCVINVGDTNKENTTENNSWYWGNIDSLSDKQVLLALGNHDAWQSGAYNNVCDKEEYDAWILPLSSRIDGLVKPTDADTLLLPYYYKDFGNIRIVVLSTYTNQTATDLAWFEDVLADAITNSKKVIAVNHISFNSMVQTSTYSEFFSNEYNKNNGFRTYGVATTTGSQQGFIPASFMAAVKTFIDNGGTFITWICGHHHRDFITDLRETSYYTTYGAIPIWNLSTARSDYQGDNPKTWSDGTGMDCFYMMSVSESLGIFKVLRFGSTTDYSMRPRLYFSYDYVGKKLITVR